MVQDKELSNPKEKRSWRKLLWLGKLVITLLILGYIYKTFRNEQKGIADIGRIFSNVLVSANAPTLVLMLLLVPINWALESMKWKQLAKRVVDLTFWDAFRGTLTGLAIGVAAPAQLGDTIGRVAALKSDNRLKAIGAAIVSNGIQFYVSVVGGTIGWFLVQDRLQMSESSKQGLNLLLLTIIFSVWLVMLFRGRLNGWNPAKKYLQKLLGYIRIIGEYTKSDLLLATTFGSLRYIVFLSQFVLALSLFDFRLGFVSLSACVALIFLAKTLIPAINVLGDLGLREFTALFVFKQYNLPPEEIITATFLIWIINVLGPILIGIFLIWKYKWKNLFR
ncbi:lysylphosphatidylglycerol synthase domain-containing protein [Dyadobacter sp. CY312]|uniref:lysylphosphatidylglycerol synthase transmembrane domain-containing protein n=1 Tax=Dyadobacter sp. CY312 TaxID=2907303 RepID=UPI001F2FC0BF|nr:lysylphosphatidylglycerol synthase domain-containing protein [Dyadobacter sp. CY312]MCE7042618.1 flippase-like domain-containing protein [Dyadobacter sp. CY312]